MRRGIAAAAAAAAGGMAGLGYYLIVSGRLMADTGWGRRVPPPRPVHGQVRPPAPVGVRGRARPEPGHAARGGGGPARARARGADEGVVQA